MLMLIIVAILIAILGFAIIRHWRMINSRSFKSSRRHFRRR